MHRREFLGLLPAIQVAAAQKPQSTASGPCTLDLAGAGLRIDFVLLDGRLRQRLMAPACGSQTYRPGKLAPQPAPRPAIMCSPSVPVGEYVLEVQASGFKLERRSRIKLDVNQNARVAVGSRTGAVAP